MVLVIPLVFFFIDKYLPTYLLIKIKTSKINTWTEPLQVKCQISDPGKSIIGTLSNIKGSTIYVCKCPPNDHYQVPYFLTYFLMIRFYLAEDTEVCNSADDTILATCNLFVTQFELYIR